MPPGPRLTANELAKVLNRDPRNIRELAEEAKDRADGVDWPVLRNQSTGEPITDKDGWAYALVASSPGRRGRPATSRGETPWSFQQVIPPQGSATLAQRFLQPGTTVGRNHKIINAIAAAAGIAPGTPVRELAGARQVDPPQVMASDGPETILGILLRPEDSELGWQTNMGDRVEVLVRGKLLLPSAGPIGNGPSWDRLLWDPENLCWHGEPLDGTILLELLGSWGLEHSSNGEEPPAVFIDSEKGLRNP
ncbi:hypothetical protein [Synechococcus sp. CBW1004]|uniref:hypothetical protein n=1 Tax=Synechococcus sp. CBW1004 TaxID=1353136 RepID=UPI0018CED479|nr:hypothetical protein [Synechococcus sp. CBW1004]QPN64704.1 hypothetical protein H8F25_08425 [Synechococcus sp. CBW1004]